MRIAIVLLALLVSLPAQAAEVTLKREYKNWTLRCERDLITDNEECSLNSKFSKYNGHKMMLGMDHDSDRKDYHYFVWMSLTAVFGRDTAVRVDRNPAIYFTPTTFPWRNSGAFHKAILFSKDPPYDVLLPQILSGKTMRVVTPVDPSGTAEFEFSLDGFTEAYAAWKAEIAKLPPRPADAKAKR